MGHNSVVSGHSKSTGIPRVDGLSTGPSDLGCHKKKDNLVSCLIPWFFFFLKTQITDKSLNSNNKKKFQGTQCFQKLFSILKDKNKENRKNTFSSQFSFVLKNTKCDALKPGGSLTTRQLVEYM